MSSTTISFPFQGATYSAEVTLTDDSYLIFVPDPSLHHILPGGTATIDLKKGLRIDSEPNLKQELLLSILGELAED